MTAAQGGGGAAHTEQIVRAIELEQSLHLDPGGAPGLDINDASGLVLPDGSNCVMPSTGAQPEVTDPPAVIDGEVQAGSRAASSHGAGDLHHDARRCRGPLVPGGATVRSRSRAC